MANGWLLWLTLSAAFASSFSGRFPHRNLIEGVLCYIGSLEEILGLETLHKSKTSSNGGGGCCGYGCCCV